MGKLKIIVGVAAVLLVASTVSPPSAGASGKSVYKKTCGYCHEFGVAGAPRKGDSQEWAPRIAQGRIILYNHAITGFKGMPAKGANPRLSDADVRNAVDYMLEHAE